jgi:hypothetical protein
MTDPTEPTEPTEPVVPPAPEPPPVRPYELPTARGVVTFGLSLAYGASSELRRASLYIGLLTLGLLGPPIVLLVEFLARVHITDVNSILDLFVNLDSGVMSVFVLLYLVGFTGVIGWLAVSIDAQLIAVALLAAREGDQHFTLREATIRARQVFWRMVRGAFIVGIVSAGIQFVLGAILAALVARGTAQGFVVSLVSVIIVAPFGYLATGVVLGDVGAVEALKRSVRLARARPRIALVVALFTLVTAGIQFFALSAGIGLFAGVADFGHVGVNGGVVPLVALILGVLALVMAYGSLSFTVAAIVTAPQVGAFLGLTYYTAGLDRARDLPPGAPKFRWVTRPMIAVILIVTLGSAYGIVSVQGVQPVGPDPIVSALRLSHPERQIFLVGGRAAVTDPAADWLGGPRDDVDIRSAEYAYLSRVPAWLLSDTFLCGKPDVTCSSDGGLDSAFSEGALVVLEEVAAPPSIPVNDSGEWGPLLDLSGFSTASGSDRFAGATDAVLTRFLGATHEIVYLGLENGVWTEFRTYARSRWFGRDLLTLLPISDEIGAAPLQWDVYAGFGALGTNVPVSSDRLTSVAGGMPVFADHPPGLVFPDTFPSP